MDVTIVEQLIGDYAFPLVMVIILCAYIYKQGQEHRADYNALHENHKKEMDSVVEALNNNTLVLQRLCDRLDMEGDK